MNCWLTGILTIGIYFNSAQAEEEACSIKCPAEGQKMVCGFAAEGTVYKMFPSACALSKHSKCFKLSFVETPLEFCIKEHTRATSSRRIWGESGPMFCPSHWMPVCGASKFRSYRYRTFNNGCYLDMINCRGEDEEYGYVEVPLEFCQRHSMKNMFKEQVIVSGIHDYRDYL